MANVNYCNCVIQHAKHEPHLPVNLGVQSYPKIRFGFFGLFLFRSSAIGNRSSAPKLRDRQFGVRFLVRFVRVGPKRTDVQTGLQKGQAVVQILNYTSPDCPVHDIHEFSA
jgi:hypothetical protein